MIKCSTCKNKFVLDSNNTWWDEKGTYSVKLTSCPYCNTVRVVKYGDRIINSGTPGYNLNKDQRYY